MKKLQLIGVAIAAMFAFGVLTAASASAVTFLLAEWLAGGAAVTTQLNIEATGELTLADLKTSAGEASVKCNGILDGWVGPNSLGFISEVLTSAGVKAGNSLSEAGIECTAVKGCSASPTPLAWALNLGWETEVELAEETGGPFWALLITSPTGKAGWEVECNVSIIKVVDECTAESALPFGAAQLSLNGTELLGNFEEAFQLLMEGKNAECTQASPKTEAGVVSGGGAIKLAGSSETLSASSESVEA